MICFDYREAVKFDIKVVEYRRVHPSSVEIAICAQRKFRNFEMAEIESLSSLFQRVQAGDPDAEIECFKRLSPIVKSSVNAAIISMNSGRVSRGSTLYATIQRRLLDKVKSGNLDIDRLRIGGLARQMAKHKLIDGIRSKGKLEAVGGTKFIEIRDDIGGSPSDYAQQSEVLAKVEECVSQLSETNQIIFRMRHNEQLAFSEIANEVGLTERATQVRFNRIVNRLKAKFGSGDAQ